MPKWSKGQSGNPNGRALEVALRKKLNDVAFDKDGNEILHEEPSGKSRKVKNLELVAEQLVVKAKKGDIAAIQECFNRIDGKVPQHVSSDSTVTHEHSFISRAAEILGEMSRAGEVGSDAGSGSDGSVLPDPVRSGETRH